MSMKNPLMRNFAGSGAARYRRYRRRSFPFLQTIFLIMGLGLYRAAIGSETTDPSIRQTLLQTMTSGTAIEQKQVVVHVEDGIVMLSGSVDNLLQKDQVLRLAESVHGVRSGVDTVSVKPIVREDEAIRRDVIRRLTKTAPRHGHDITVAVENGDVTLTGQADSWVLSRLMTRKAMSITGVAQVTDEIEVIARPDRADSDIAMDV